MAIPLLPAASGPKACEYNSHVAYLIGSDILCRTMGSQLALPVAILHAFAFGLGYWMCRLLGFNEKTARTVSIETGAGLVSSPALCPPSKHLRKINPMTSL